MIPQDFVDQLLSRVDIIDVVDRHVPLKKAGQNYLACCPFHKEKSPSFTVSPAKQFYHCFGCGAHGSAIGFVMEYQGLGFVDAVKQLADSVGLSVPEERGVDVQRRQAERARQLTLEDALNQAAQFYRQQLKTAPNAISYLKGRGLSGEVAAHFGLGYAPPGWQGLEAVFPNYQDERLVEAGLVIAGEDGKRYDRFRERVMFPIRNQRGAIIGFGGRVLGKGEPKYLNSPETPLFEKGRELYGLYEARQAIREQNRVLVVEGYMDVVALAQYGVRYAVASLGTATTADHVRKLLRHADQVYFCFDGDAAGRKAAWRALENSLPQLVDGKALNFLFLPAEHDPDSYVREHGAEAFEACLVEQSLPLSAYLFHELSGRVAMDSPEGRADLVRQALPLLEQVKAPALALLLRKRLAELAGVASDEIGELMGLARPAPASGRRDYKLPVRSHRQQVTPMVHRQIQWLLLNPAWAEDVQVPDSLVLSDEVACFAMLAEYIQAQSEVPSTGQLLEALRDTPFYPLLDAVIERTLREPEEFAEPGESDRQGFREGVLKLWQGLRDAQLEQLKEKSHNEGLTPEEKRLLCALLVSGVTAGDGLM